MVYPPQPKLYRLGTSGSEIDMAAEKWNSRRLAYIIHAHHTRIVTSGRTHYKIDRLLKRQERIDPVINVPRWYIQVKWHCYDKKDDDT